MSSCPLFTIASSLTVPPRLITNSSLSLERQQVAQHMGWQLGWHLLFTCSRHLHHYKQYYASYDVGWCLIATTSSCWSTTQDSHVTFVNTVSLHRKSRVRQTDRQRAHLETSNTTVKSVSCCGQVGPPLHRRKQDIWRPQPAARSYRWAEQSIVCNLHLCVCSVQCTVYCILY